MGNRLKPINFVGRSRADLLRFPHKVRRDIGYALYRIQGGSRPANAKPLKGFGGISVQELVADHKGDTFRAVYTVRFAKAVYVLHCFQKKSKKGSATSKQDIDLIKKRLNIARADYEQNYEK